MVGDCLFSMIAASVKPLQQFPGSDAPLAR
jgi:hypothetical protein